MSRNFKSDIERIEEEIRIEMADIILENSNLPIEQQKDRSARLRYKGDFGRETYKEFMDKAPQRITTYLTLRELASQYADKEKFEAAAKLRDLAIEVYNMDSPRTQDNAR